MHYYQLAERVTLSERKQLGISMGVANLPSDCIGNRQYIRAICTEEFRPPRKGERYLSGAIPQAYVAPSDLTDGYHILRLVIVAKQEQWVRVL